MHLNTFNSVEASLQHSRLRYQILDLVLTAVLAAIGEDCLSATPARLRGTPWGGGR